VDKQQLISTITANLGSGERICVGSDSPDSFYLDLERLSQINSSNVMSIISAVGIALQSFGQSSDVDQALKITNNVLSE
jgi:hypothetical protein